MDLEGLGFPVLVISESAAGLLPFPGGDRSLGTPSPLGFEPPTAAPPGFKGGKLESEIPRRGWAEKLERSWGSKRGGGEGGLTGGSGRGGHGERRDSLLPRLWGSGGRAGARPDGEELRGGELATERGRSRRSVAARRWCRGGWRGGDRSAAAMVVAAAAARCGGRGMDFDFRAVGFQFGRGRRLPAGEGFLYRKFKTVPKKEIQPQFTETELPIVPYNDILKGTDGFSEANVLGKGRYPPQLTKTELPIVPYNDILKGTDGFSEANVLGKGRYGTVYRGSLGNQAIAVASSMSSNQGHTKASRLNVRH
ncbi:hypothetical protein HU200_040773 [Digitaria exilis]|uniref:Uncharacterized protein n=1 Tax=Digitaria exilis TaxID=1010633 RepID=A0A835B4M0_9POAL|nr:hypothetical protein HU200_040773 [Digitaria exilis]